MNWLILTALVLIAGSGLYVRLRWRRSPQAYHAMIALAVCYFVAGSLTSAWFVHLTTRNPATPQPVSSAPTPTSMVKSWELDVAHAVLPDPKLTPGDTLPGVTAADVCTPGWATEHRNVTQEMRYKVYAEYGRTQGQGCCELDHLVPLELGGSNDVKNLWPEPYDPRPASAEKDQLENELHARVCAGKMTLADAQHCIASNWIKCWEQHAMPPGTATAATHP